MQSLSFLSSISWQAPWLKPLRQRALPLLDAILAAAMTTSASQEATGAAMRAALQDAASAHNLRTEAGLPLRFVPQAELPSGMAYEAFIAASGGVPTRDNLHDFFNALVWLHFPKTKARLNALQAAEIQRSEAVPRPAAGAPWQRGKLRDGATLFDENAALLIIADADLLDALRQHRWQEAFLQRRSAFRPPSQRCEVRLFGHALMEKLVQPYKGITAHAWPLVVREDFFALPEAERQRYIDRRISQQLHSGLQPAHFTPLPVLGVPGWWPAQDAAFYGDTHVFRPKRRRQSPSRA